MKKSQRTLLAVLLMLLACTSPGSAQERPQLADTLVGGEFFYTVQLGDTLTSIGARFGVAAGMLARENGLQPSTRLKIGQELRVYNRHIVLPELEDGIFINLPPRGFGPPGLAHGNGCLRGPQQGRKPCVECPEVHSGRDASLRPNG